MMKILVSLKGFTDGAYSPCSDHCTLASFWTNSCDDSSSTHSGASGKRWYRIGVSNGITQHSKVRERRSRSDICDQKIWCRESSYGILSFSQPTTNRGKFCKVVSCQDLPEVVAFRKQVAAANVRSDMIRTLSDAIADEKSGKEIISELKEFVVKTGISEQEV